MPIRAPPPRQSSINPMAPSLSCTLSLMKGMLDAHAAVANPEQKKVALVASLSMCGSFMASADSMVTPE
ncbi:hypothetical protein D3C79_649620 [compost metagenome]